MKITDPNARLIPSLSIGWSHFTKLASSRTNGRLFPDPSRKDREREMDLVGDQQVAIAIRNPRRKLKDAAVEKRPPCMRDIS